MCPKGIELPLRREEWRTGILMTASSESQYQLTQGESEVESAHGEKRYVRQMKEEHEEEKEDAERTRRAHAFVNALMLGPESEAQASKVDFITEAHRPRVYKQWVKELADIVRDYFWYDSLPILGSLSMIQH